MGLFFPDWSLNFTLRLRSERLILNLFGSRILFFKNWLLFLLVFEEIEYLLILLWVLPKIFFLHGYNRYLSERFIYSIQRRLVKTNQLILALYLFNIFILLVYLL